MTKRFSFWSPSEINDELPNKGVATQKRTSPQFGRVLSKWSPLSVSPVSATPFGHALLANTVALHVVTLAAKVHEPGVTSHTDARLKQKTSKPSRGVPSEGKTWGCPPKKQKSLYNFEWVKWKPPH